MKIICISEHYNPIVGGTVTYVNNICKYLSKQGHEIILVVPGKEENGNKTVKKDAYTIIKLGIGTNIKNNYTTQKRYLFCDMVNQYLKKYCESHSVDIVHILFGLYVTKKLEVEYLKSHGITTVVSIHNVPPKECSISWKGDNSLRYFKDEIRKIGVKLVNKKRIQKNNFDAYIVMCDETKQLLSKYISIQKITVTDLGCHPQNVGSGLKKIHNKTHSVKILTVGGFVPHKNQHLIPRIATILKREKIKFQWDLVGPIRNKRYFSFIERKIKSYQIEDCLKLNVEIPFDQLVGLYQNANLYVQTSSEEGFCMTTLDAAIYGLPIVGTPTGAIAKIIENATGILANYNTEAISKAIIKWHDSPENYTSSEEIVEQIGSLFSWENSIKTLLSVYHELVAIQHPTNKIGD